MSLDLTLCMDYQFCRQLDVKSIMALIIAIYLLMKQYMDHVKSVDFCPIYSMDNVKFMYFIYLFVDFVHTKLLNPWIWSNLCTYMLI